MNSRRRVLAIVFLACALAAAPGLAAPVKAGTQPTSETRFILADAEQGRAAVARVDEYIRLLSPHERAVRMRAREVPTTETLLRFYADNVIEWGEPERAKMQAAIDSIRPALRSLGVRLPATVLIIETTGQEEGDSAYTRANTIMFPRTMIARVAPAMLRRIVAHETFHVLSRSDPKLRRRLYETIGFRACNEVELPRELRDWRMTNPDSPRNDYCIRVRLAGKPVWAVPVLYTEPPVDGRERAGVFDGFRIKLLIANNTGTESAPRLSYDEANPRLVAINDVSGFFEQIGGNSNYILYQPDEILAENFAHIVCGSATVPSPKLLEQIKAALSQE